MLLDSTVKTATFDSWSSFLQFKRKVVEESRYFHDAEVQRFCAGVLMTAQDRVKTIPQGYPCWRAQFGCDDDPIYVQDEIVDYNAVPFTTERMKPSRRHPHEGRVNPRGIPCLYLSEEELTAISEVRPWVGTYVTVARFKTVRDLRIVDCRSEIDPTKRSVHDLDKLFRLNPQESEETTRIVWCWLNVTFSEPVDRNDQAESYVPTQIIAELFKANGFDGIEYRSVFNAGHNLALFDSEAARQIDAGRVVQVTSIDVGLD
jgi:hypothetical protein